MTELILALVGLTQILVVGLVATERFGWPAAVGAFLAMTFWTLYWRRELRGD